MVGNHVCVWVRVFEDPEVLATSSSHPSVAKTSPLYRWKLEPLVKKSTCLNESLKIDWIELEMKRTLSDKDQLNPLQQWGHLILDESL